MADMSLSAGPLIKISLLIDLASQGGGAIAPRKTPLSFIFGLAGDGLTPFETALYGKRIGDRLALTAEPGELGRLLGHLFHELNGASEYCSRACCMEVTITDLAEADSRELVKALARMVEGCGGCDCGCGCGS